MTKLFIVVFICFMSLSCSRKEKAQITEVTDSLPAMKIKATATVDTATVKGSIIINPELLYGIWTLDNNGPHADFELTKKSFYVVDYDGDGTMPYKISNDTITVNYPDYNNIGIIRKVMKDTLIINWNNGSDITYFKWKG